MGRAIYKYVDCGPWVVFTLDKERTVGGEKTDRIYYEDKSAWSLRWAKYCDGLEIGSIVEGSDAEIGPEFLPFPITHDELWETISGINKQAGEEWENANTNHFCIQKDGDNYANVTWTEFDDKPKWDEDKDSPVPERVKKAWRNWYIDGRWDKDENGMKISATIVRDKPLPFGVKGWLCIHYAPERFF
jgi:hypothetical protein